MSEGEIAEPIARTSYEEFGEDYAAAIENNAYNANYERPSTLALIPDVSGKRVLDAGCGPGAYVKLLLQKGASVVGMDVSPRMLDIAQRKFGRRAEFVLHDLSRPLKMFEDRSFDLILSSLTIHYIEDQAALFSEFNRILRPGGQIVFSTHHPAMDFQYSPSQDYFKRELLEQDWDTIGRPVRVRFYRRSLSEITGALTSAGFVIEAMTEGCLTDELRERYPDVYARLSKSPQFLFFRAAKRSSFA